MDNQSPDTLPSVELPSPQRTEQGIDFSGGAENTQEQASAQRLEQGVAVPPAMPPVNNPDPVASIAPQVVAPHTPPPSGVTGVSMMPQIAEDNDLIEKEWVEKAKQIVEHTKHDPHQQSKEMNTMKADYLKKRYNKDLKLGD